MTARSGEGNSGTLTLGLIVTFALASFLVAAVVTPAGRLYRIRSAASELSAQMEAARRIAWRDDVDQRMRAVDEQSYVREHRAGAGWIVDETFRLPDGITLNAVEPAVFHSRGNVGPELQWTLVDQEIVMVHVAGRRDGEIGITTDVAFSGLVAAHFN